MCLAGMAAAGVYGALAAVLKVKFGTNETLMTLMLNYVALYFLIFLGGDSGGVELLPGHLFRTASDF